MLVGPKIGEDAAIIQDDGKVLVIHSDPITGASQDIGRLAVHVSVNDVVSKGADPRWVSIVLLLNPEISRDGIRRIAFQAHQVCLEVGASIIGGHTEVTPTVERPVIISTVVGEAKAGRFFTSSGARPDDRIIMTKTAALEGTAILAHQFPDLGKVVGEKVIRSARNFLDNISIYPEARIARQVPGVTAMHDVTEGGVLCAVQEVAIASRCGFEVDSLKIPVASETSAICAELSLDPLRTIGSGSLIITVRGASADSLLRKFRAANLQATEIGKMMRKGHWIFSEGKRKRLSSFTTEELWKVVS